MTRVSLTRRDLLRFGARSLGGLTLADQLHSQALGKTRATAQHCIFVFLNGGPAHLDTFDMKPEAPVDIRGLFRPIETCVPGVHISVDVNGAAFGINNNTAMTIVELLSRANARTRKSMLAGENGDGAISSAETVLRSQIAVFFGAINNM